MNILNKKLLLIINPVSGLRLGTLYIPKISSLFTAGGYDVFTMLTAKKGDAEKWASEYGEHADVIVACGGDGTFNEVVSGNLHGSNKPLGYIPCGSTNDFAASIGLSIDIATAAKNIAEGSEHSFDAGSFDGRSFTYVASFGAFTKASYNTPQKTKNIIGHLAYIFEGGMELKNLKPEHISIESDGVIYEGDYLFGAISNSTSLGGVLSISREMVDMNDGKFECMLIKNPENALQLSKILHAITAKQFEACEMIEFFSAEKLVINKGPENGWSLDGEFEQGRDGAAVENLHSAIKLIF